MKTVVFTLQVYNVTAKTSACMYSNFCTNYARSLYCAWTAVIWICICTWCQAQI